MILPTRLLQLAFDLVKKGKLSTEKIRLLRTLALRSFVLISLFSCFMVVGLFFVYRPRLHYDKQDLRAYTCIGISFLYFTIVISYPLVISMQHFFDIIVGIKESKLKKRRNSSVSKKHIVLMKRIKSHTFYNTFSLLKKSQIPEYYFPSPAVPPEQKGKSGSVYFW